MTQTFQPDKPYFFIVYQDRDLRIPVVDTLFFKRRDTGNDGKSGYVFKKVVAFEGMTDEVFFDADAAKDGILDFDGLIIELQASNARTLATDPATGRKNG